MGAFVAQPCGVSLALRVALGIHWGTLGIHFGTHGCSWEAFEHFGETLGLHLGTLGLHLGTLGVHVGVLWAPVRKRLKKSTKKASDWGARRAVF